VRRRLLARRADGAALGRRAQDIKQDDADQRGGGHGRDRRRDIQVADALARQFAGETAEAGVDRPPRRRRQDRQGEGGDRHRPRRQQQLEPEALEAALRQQTRRPVDKEQRHQRRGAAESLEHGVGEPGAGQAHGVLDRAGDGVVPRRIVRIEARQRQTGEQRRDQQQDAENPQTQPPPADAFAAAATAAATGVDAHH
jgi:hypothetical protein